jgi:hypothetical protein
MVGMAGFECVHDVLVSRVVEQVGQKVGQTSQNQGYIHGIKMSIYRLNFILNIGINFYLLCLHLWDRHHLSNENKYLACALPKNGPFEPKST